jgi:hypothetical protein
MTTNRKRATFVLAFAFALALAFGLATACYGTNPFTPNYIPGDSLRKDSSKNQG